MAVELNHTIVPARDPQASAQFLADILGLSVDPPVAHFTPVTLANAVSLDFDHYEEVDEHHYAFQLSDQEFEAAFGRIRDRGITYYADPGCRPARPGLRQQERSPWHLLPGPGRTPHGDPHPNPSRASMSNEV
jgi:catechol 2,3-dioxygenase-like lactoylglutathione lyase family enzyme